MEKKAKRASHAPMGSNQEDQISELPDEILVIILSRLEIKEAARTSVLKHRWRNLWKFFTGCLDFQASETMRLKKIYIEAPNYRDWVNKVLNSHHGSTLEKLRIAFDLGRFCSSDIDKWVDFAIAKRVRSFELNLQTRYYVTRWYSSAYIFPSWLLDIPSEFPSFDRLNELCLLSVSITEEDLAYFLSKCLLLEKLILENASYIEKIRVAGESLKLRHLRIGYCLSLGNVEVSATNLVSFGYAGPKINIAFENVPQLSLVSLGFRYTEISVVEYHRSMNLSRLVNLELDLDSMSYGTCMSFPLDFPEFSNLKQLELKFIAAEGQSILFLSSIVGASPLLDKLTLKYETDCFTGTKSAFAQPGRVELLEEREKQWEERARNHRHQCLQVVEFVGWVGLKNDVQFATYLFESATSLEKIILDSRVPPFIGRSWTEGDEESALLSAMKLEKKLPPTAKLFIL